MNQNQEGSTGNDTGGEASSSIRPVVLLMVVLTIAGLIAAGLYVFRNGTARSLMPFRSGPAISPDAATSTTPDAKPLPKDAAGAVRDAPRESTDADTASRFIGTWNRLDGGYSLEIRRIDDDGRMDAVYLNPAPVHVAEAKLQRQGDRPYAMITLQDKGYPGSFYSLYYNRKHDVLYGVYFHAGMNQRFDVIFKRTS